MKIRAAVLAVVVFALGAGEAQAHTVITCDPCSYPYQRWVNRAKVPTPDVVVSLQETDASNPDWPCPSTALGCASGYEKWILLNRLNLSRYTDRWGTRLVFLHELGHIFDAQILTDWERTSFATLEREPNNPWYGAPGQSEGDFGTSWPPDEVFAEEFAYCAIYGHVKHGPVAIIPGVGRIGKQLHNRFWRLLARDYFN